MTLSSSLTAALSLLESRHLGAQAAEVLLDAAAGWVTDGERDQLVRAADLARKGGGGLDWDARALRRRAASATRGVRLLTDDSGADALDFGALV
mgnify:CR=1 FL=1